MDNDQVAAEVEAAERAVWEALVAGDKDADRALLSEDFLGVYPSGFATRDEHVGEISDGPSMASYSLSQITVRRYADDLALIAYRADYTRAGHSGFEAMLISSLWRREPGGAWVNLFSQDTPVD